MYSMVEFHFSMSFRTVARLERVISGITDILTFKYMSVMPDETLSSHATVQSALKPIMFHTLGTLSLNGIRPLITFGLAKVRLFESSVF